VKDLLALALSEVEEEAEEVEEEVEEDKIVNGIANKNEMFCE